MHSSTSSSNVMVDWKTLWAVVLVGLLAVVTASEFALRQYGWTPAYQDSARLFANVRRQATTNQDGVVIVGSSKAQLGIDPRRLLEHSARR